MHIGDKRSLDFQQNHWEKTFIHYSDMFGDEPSQPARFAAALFKKEGKTRIIELGAGQGRDTIFFAQQGLNVCAIEYTEVGAKAIEQKSLAMGLSGYITVVRHDVRDKLPFDDETFDACYSHMLFCMAVTTKEIVQLSDEIRRILSPGGINIFTVRNTDDKHYGQGIHRGEDLYEVDGFVVHFFSREKIELLIKNGVKLIDLQTFEEGVLPKKLFQVTLQKTAVQET